MFEVASASERRQLCLDASPHRSAEIKSAKPEESMQQSPMPVAEPRCRQHVPLRAMAASPLYWPGIWSGGLD